ncbi:MAG: retropepsin-like aspartic protease, partial [Cyanobacteria bacterium P01_C01_bin.73]
MGNAEFSRLFYCQQGLLGIVSARLGTLLLAGAMVLGGVSCANRSPSASESPDSVDSALLDSSAPSAAPESESEPESEAPADATATPVAEPPAVVEPSVASEFYAQGIERASSAFTFSRRASSPDDWRLVASRWQQAIDLMAAVPEGDPNRAIAQQKVQEYQSNLQAAQRRAEQIITAAQTPVPSVSPSQTSVSNGTSSPAPSTGSASGVYEVPILRRLSGTPVVPVTINGQRFEMILDTGASGTLVTAAMANRLSIRPVGRTQVATASAASVSFQVGFVDVIQVGGIVVTDIPVAIAGPALDVGLLGNDVFGSYDITIRQSTVEFRAR